MRVFGFCNVWMCVGFVMCVFVCVGFVMCGCVWVLECVDVCGFCNVCVCVGFLICGCVWFL